MNQEGKLTESKNVTGVTENAPGIFCLTGISGTLHTVVATIDYNESVQLSVIRATLGRGADKACPSGTDVTVQTSAAVLEAGKLEEAEEPEGFFVTMD